MKLNVFTNATSIGRFVANVTLMSDGRTMLRLKMASTCGDVTGTVTTLDELVELRFCFDFIVGFFEKVRKSTE